jgi:hypothetical protein
MTRITRTLTAAGLALSIAIGTVGASATPARANNEDAVAIIGGLIALYAIGQALQNDNRNVTVTRNYGHRPPPQAHVPQHPPRSWWRPRAASSRGATGTAPSAAMSGAACRTTSARAPIFFRRSACAASRPSVGPG